MLQPKLAFAASGAAGAVLPLAFAPFDQFWLAPLSYAVLFYLWRGASPKHGFWVGTTYGLASFGTGTYWTYISIHDYGQASVLLSAAISGALIVTLALFVGIVGWLAARWFRTAGAQGALVTLPALWLLLEWCRGWFMTGFGWLSAGYTQTGSWLMGYAPVLGLHGMSAAVMVSAGALVTLAIGTAVQRRIGFAVLLAVWVVGFALTGYRWTQPKSDTLTVALVQGAIEQDLKWRPEQLPSTLALYRRLTEQSEGNELIVWPEAAIPVPYEYIGDYVAEIKDWADRHGSIVMLGILRGIPDTEIYQNALVALTDPPGLYIKRHLVPFGEYFPVPDFIRSWLRLMSLPYTDLASGNPEQPALEVLGERIAVTICYEDVFGAEQLHYLPEATLLVNVSNDAWFGDSIAPHQHLQIAQLRAAEAGRYLLRSTNTGISAVIDPRGRVVSRIPQFEPGVLEYLVHGYQGSTPYARWGNYPVVLLAFAALLGQLLTTKLRIRPGT